MNKRLIKYLEVNNVPQQYGFRAKNSTVDAVHDVTQFIVANLDEGKTCLLVFLDLAKAFDKVSILLLLRKLERLRIRGQSLNLFRSYLTNRNQLVKINNHLSDELPVLYGVPQGSILSPALFVILSITSVIFNYGKKLSFADDTPNFSSRFFARTS